MQNVRVMKDLLSPPSSGKYRGKEHFADLLMDVLDHRREVDQETVGAVSFGTYRIVGADEHCHGARIRKDADVKSPIVDGEAGVIPVGAVVAVDKVKVLRKKKKGNRSGSFENALRLSDGRGWISERNASGDAICEQVTAPPSALAMARAGEQQAQARAEVEARAQRRRRQLSGARKARRGQRPPPIATPAGSSAGTSSSEPAPEPEQDESVIWQWQHFTVWMNFPDGAVQALNRGWSAFQAGGSPTIELDLNAPLYIGNVV